ncbi:MAG: hypothetical protein K6G47_02750 [Clostridia bacterium]|nr:hypothetical protein [Clostridia bacterium]
MKKPKAVAASLLLFCAVAGLTGCPQNVYGPPPDLTKDNAEQTQESQAEETEETEEIEEVEEETEEEGETEEEATSESQE